jgi:hypothetical protein
MLLRKVWKTAAKSIAADKYIYIERRKAMESRNRSLERVWSGISWGLALILIGVLIFADNQGWTHGGEEWLYFAIGLGALFIVGFLVRYFGNHGILRRSIGGLVIGLALVYTGIIFLNDLGNWWPMALFPIGAGYIISAFWRSKSESYSQTNQNQGHISGN